MYICGICGTLNYEFNQLNGLNPVGKLVRFSLFYFLLRDALAVDGAPGEDDVGEHERDEEGNYRHGAERELAAAAVGEGERTLKVDVRRIVGGVVPAGYQQQNQHGEHGSDARKPDSLSILHVPR